MARLLEDPSTRLLSFRCCETFFPSFSMDAFVPRYAHREEGRKRIAEEVIDAMKIISMETELRTD